MKRLLDCDDPDDEVVRLLIRAGAQHQPSPRSKLRMIAALGLGSAVGLSASKVLAWLGTSSGKLALAVTVAGTAAGGAYVLTSASPAPEASEAVAPRSVDAAVAPRVAHETGLPEPPARASSHEPSASEPSASEPSADALRERPAPSRQARARQRPQPADRAPTPTQPAPPPEPVDLEASLTEETHWVDRLRVAAEAGDRPSFERLARDYGERFPEGQLHPEVNRLRTSLR
ncbi:MAG TPA: hypothetical protein VMG12_32605 [Polyangiaceae bacterium]|nr:hypothetical protein [Polyangiaceae bacterium]